MDAAFMSLELHDGGIHVVWPGAGEAGVTGVRFGRVPWPAAGARPTKIKPEADRKRLTGDMSLMVQLRLKPYSASARRPYPGTHD
jgi:hypothetical protein